MDEPFSALDPLIRRELQNQFVSLTKTLNKTTVFITHDLDEAIRIGDRIAIMKDGKLIQVGTPEQIVMQPQDEYVADFVKDISNLNLIKAHSIMAEIGPATMPAGLDMTAAPRVDEDASLKQLIDVSTSTDLPIVVTDKNGLDIGVINKNTLLLGIKGGNKNEC